MVESNPPYKMFIIIQPFTTIWGSWLDIWLSHDYQRSSFDGALYTSISTRKSILFFSWKRLITGCRELINFEPLNWFVLPHFYQWTTYNGISLRYWRRQRQQTIKCCVVQLFGYLFFLLQVFLLVLSKMGKIANRLTVFL